MKYIITIILITKVLLANALSFSEVPLNRMIDESEFIYSGRIINVTETDSSLQKQLRNIVRSDNYKFDDPSCGYCSETATFVISKSLKGQIQNDTILIPFHRNFMSALPGFSKNREYILFLDKLDGFDFFAKTDPRFGAKSSYLNEYKNLITEYLFLKSDSEKRAWVIDLCINPRLSREGMLNFKFSSSNHFSESEKRIMTEGLIKMDFNNDRYLKLIKCVEDFGKNDDLIKKCFGRLKLVNEENVYEGLDLMQAINEMDPKPKYKKLIDDFFDGFDNKLSDSVKLELIREFIRIKN